MAVPFSQKQTILVVHNCLLSIVIKTMYVRCYSFNLCLQSNLLNALHATLLLILIYCVCITVTILIIEQDLPVLKDQ